MSEPDDLEPILAALTSNYPDADVKVVKRAYKQLVEHAALLEGALEVDKTIDTARTLAELRLDPVAVQLPSVTAT